MLIRQLLSSLTILLVVLGGAALSAAPQGSERDALSAFRKEFRSHPRAPKEPAARTAALAHLKGLDSKAVAEVLVKAADAVQLEVDTQRAAYDATQAELRGLSNSKRGRVPPERRTELRNLVRRDRLLLDDLRQLRIAVGARIAKLRSAEAVIWMLEKVSGSKRYPIMVKLRVGEAAGSAGAEVRPALRKALKKSREPEEMCVLIRAIGSQGRAMQPAAEDLIELLEHKNGLVRESAAQALARLEEALAIEPMIELLARSYGQEKKRLGSALEILTRQAFGISAGSWRRWWAAEKDLYLSGSKELGGGKPSTVKKANQKNYYFGIPQDGKSIIYVIDRSGSMKAKVDFQLPQPGGGRTVARRVGEKIDNKTTRLEACKQELIRALKRLEPSVSFNIVSFSSGVSAFQNEMHKASPETIAEAIKWVQKLQPSGSTNIYDSMRKAFEFAGTVGEKRRGPTTGRKTKQANPDTIFLLSDGSPTLPPGDKPDDPQKIIKGVRDWNPLKGVIVHCIGIGKGVNRRFMGQLARENGGEFKQF